MWQCAPKLHKRSPNPNMLTLNSILGDSSVIFIKLIHFSVVLFESFETGLKVCTIYSRGGRESFQRSQASVHFYQCFLGIIQVTNGRNTWRFRVLSGQLLFMRRAAVKAFFSLCSNVRLNSKGLPHFFCSFSDSLICYQGDLFV